MMARGLELRTDAAVRAQLANRFIGLTNPYYFALVSALKAAAVN